MTPVDLDSTTTTSHPFRRRTAAAATLVLTCLVAGLFAFVTAPPDSASAASAVNGRISRSEVIERARHWLSNPPPGGYNTSRQHADIQGKAYRTDCSGYASMALHLSGSFNTAQLATPTYTTQITKADLKAGDLLIHPPAGPKGHVLIFEKWANAAQTSAWMYDFGGGSAPRYRALPFPGAQYRDGRIYNAYRYKNIVDDTATTPSTGSGPVRVAVLQANGSLLVKEGPLNATWTKVADGVEDLDLSGDRIGIRQRNSGDLLVKEGPLNATWTMVAGDVVGFDLDGNRIGIRRPNGAFSVKEGPLNATWTKVADGVEDLDLSGDRIGIRQRNSGDLLVKEGPLNATWTMVAGDVVGFDLDGNRIGIRRPNGAFSVKEGPLNATWTKVADGVEDLDLSGDRIGIRQRNSGDLLVKEGPLNATWTMVAGDVVGFDLDGNRIGIRRPNGAFSVKEGPLNATWTAVASGAAAQLSH